MRVLPFRLLFGFVLLLLVGSLAAVFFSRHEWAWAIGILFLTYDAVLLTAITTLAWRGVVRSEAPRTRHVPPPELAVLVPCRNEKSVISACLEALIPQMRTGETIWVIDDGSIDGTVAWLGERYGVVMDGHFGESRLFPILRVWSKPSSGKANSLNELIPRCGGEVIVTIDADTVPTRDSLKAIREEFRDPEMAAACGVLIPACRGGFLGRTFEYFQRSEYMRAYLWRLAWSRIDAMEMVSGAFGAYRREVVEKVGFFDPASWVEDYELIFRVYREAGDSGKKWRVGVIGTAQAVTDAPATVSLFWKQRSRWFGGFLATLFSNQDMVANPRYGTMGGVLLPAKTIDTLLPFFSAGAQLTFLVLLLESPHIAWGLLGFIAAKLVFDICLQSLSFFLYARWLRRPVTPGWAFRIISASLLEPFFFQPLRYSGAILGWVALLRNRMTWTPQRAAGTELPDAEQG